ncbi:hypothetical protein [Roseiconus lacunae]|uniref:hypothetical protein n=1 Tax=Roseiconus lacunae TaxID=2605694 RepID=UPI001E591713|nr:hypothetical protein [Roseiconus lacunae]
MSAMNFYWTFLRYPIHRLRGGTGDDYRWISAAPLVGSVLVVVTLPFLDTPSWVWWFGVACAAADTGGIHWFVVTMAWMTLAGRLR